MSLILTLNSRDQARISLLNGGDEAIRLIEWFHYIAHGCGIIKDLAEASALKLFSGPSVKHVCKHPGQVTLLHTHTQEHQTTSRRHKSQPVSYTHLRAHETEADL
eukprot:2160485-Amphidinium_carterae.1